MAIVAAIQMCSSNNVEDNLREAGQWIQKAAKSVKNFEINAHN